MQTLYPYQPRCHAPDKIAFVMCATGEQVSFGKLEARANQGAHVLRAAGIGVGQHIAILIENRREFLEICFAADRAGVYYTTISTQLTQYEIDYILADCGARMLIGSERFAATMNSLVATHGESCEFYLLDDHTADHTAEQAADNTAEQATDPAGNFKSWSQATAEMPETPVANEQQGLDMLYSSGTTGRPKGIKWPLTEDPPGARTMLVHLLTSLFGYSATTRYLSPAPLYHAAPLRHSMVTIRAGGTVFIMEKFDALDALRLIEEHRITHSQWVPTMFVRMLKLPAEQRQRFDLSSMQMAVHAAAPCPVSIKRQMIDWWGGIIDEYYAGTENNGFTSITCAEWLENPGSVGQPRLGVLHICDEHGVELPAGEEGEIYFENGHQFVYHNDPAKTAGCTNAMGWTTLGDIGRLSEDGYLYLTDRKSFVIISGGVNVYPQETENTLLTHPSVLDAAVIGVPNEDFGEEIKAIVQLVSPDLESEQLEHELIEFTRKQLSAIKCPRSIEFRTNLPRSATGKLYKRKLKEEFWN